MKRIIKVLVGIMIILGISGSATLSPELLEGKLNSISKNSFEKSGFPQNVKKEFIEISGLVSFQRKENKFKKQLILHFEYIYIIKFYFVSYAKK